MNDEKLSSSKSRVGRLATWFSVVIICAGFIYWFWPHPRYFVEVRHVAADGTVTFEPQQYEVWKNDDLITGLRRHTRDVIYHAVYFPDVLYCFSRSGRVYGMLLNEKTVPSTLIQTWEWSGHPHDFPQYALRSFGP